MRLITADDFAYKGYQDLIIGFDKDQLTPAGYDFRAGACRNLTTGEETILAGGKVLEVYHGDFVTILTKESVNMRNRADIFGLVFSKVSFASRGLSHVGTKIDPGFEGKLKLSFENRGYEVFQITENTSICNVAFIEIPDTGGKYFPSDADFLPSSVIRTSLRLPFPLKRSESLQNRQWFSMEVLDAYIQLSEELENFRAEVAANLDRAERIYTGAILTTFLAAIAVVAVLVAAAALFVNQLRVPLNSTLLSTSLIFAGVIVFVYTIWSLRKILSGEKTRKIVDAGNRSFAANG